MPWKLPAAARTSLPYRLTCQTNAPQTNLPVRGRIIAHSGAFAGGVSNPRDTVHSLGQHTALLSSGASHSLAQSYSRGVHFGCNPCRIRNFSAWVFFNTLKVYASLAFAKTLRHSQQIETCDVVVATGLAKFMRAFLPQKPCKLAA